MVHLTISSLDNKDQPIHLESWLQELSEKYRVKNLAILRQAGALAQIAGSHRATPNGESCLHQGLTMAEILAELNVSSETLAAAILYSSVRYADLHLEDITEQFGKTIADIISGTTQMEAINILHGENYRPHDTQTIDNIRKMLLAMVSDVDVVLIKLAERLCVLRNVAIFGENKKKQVAKETLDVYAPLANRLGIGQLKWQLEDFSFRYLNPDHYKKISQNLNERRVDRENFIRQTINELTALLQEADVHNFKISGRAKHIYSIYRKMLRKKVDIEHIYDISAIRILVPTIEDCYAALGSVHSRWQHINHEFDDYIAKPKPNGYRSIHTAVYGPANKIVEIQIRTFQMHEESELGVAAHWMYKEGAKPSTYQEKITWLRQVLDWQKEIATTEAAKEDVQTQLLDDRVYVFTPKGEVLDLEKGATPLDFAYQIHSGLGHRCRGAKINGQIVPLTHKLNTGEQIEIMTVKQGGPSRDWVNPHLKYVHTSRAKAKILQWFRKQDYDKNLAQGQELLEKELKKSAIKNPNLEHVAHKLNYKNLDDLLAALGHGDVSTQVVINNLQPAIITEPAKTTFKPKLSETLTDIDVQGVGNLLTHVALCCKPIPGDDIVGYVTRGKGISIHRKDCANILRLEKSHNDKIINVNWGGATQKEYPLDLAIEARNRPEIVRDVSNIFANENIPLLNINCHYDLKENIAHITVTITINNLAPLKKIFSRLKQLQDVFSVERI